MWLMPRLAAFRSAHPEIVIEFETDHTNVDPARRAFDIWIAFVAGVPRTVQSEVLFEETFVPVCSPAFLASRQRPTHPGDLHEWPLLYDLAWEDYWTHWFACQQAGAPDMSRASGYRLYSMTIQAALEGMGVALGHSLLIAPHLERGTLVALFEPPVAAPARYFLALAPRLPGEARGAGVPGLAADRDAQERCGREARGGARPSSQRLRRGGNGRADRGNERPLSENIGWLPAPNSRHHRTGTCKSLVSYIDVACNSFAVC